MRRAPLEQMILEGLRQRLMAPDMVEEFVTAFHQHYNRERPHSALGYEPPERFAHRLGALGLDEGPHASPALAPASGPCYDLNGSPSPWT